MKRILVVLLCALPLAGKAQIRAIGLSAGMTNGWNDEYFFQAGNFSIYALDINEGRLTFGVFLEHTALKRFHLSHHVFTNSTYLRYYTMGSPTGNKGISASAFSIKYNGLLRLLNWHGLRLAAGAGLDFNSNRYKDYTPDFRDTTLNEISSQLKKTINPIVYYVAAEVGYRAGRFDLSFKYNHSITPITRSLEYQGEIYPIPIRAGFFFFNFSYLIYANNKRTKE